MKTCLFFIIILSCSVKAEYFTEFVSPQVNSFNHDNGNSGDYYYPEIVGSGVAVFDFDNDGDLDIYLVQSGQFKNNQKSDRFLKNLYSETGVLKFEDITRQTDLNNHEYGIGIAVADINNDGWKDFFLGNLQNNQLFLNQQGQSFREVTLKESAKFSTSASFCDINNDGYQDLYISNYVDWSEQNNPKCFNSSSKRDYCGPGSFSGLKDTFYLNKSGTLVEKTSAYFPTMPAMPGLNVVCVDVNNDGWNDFVVANDGKANLLWLNQKGTKFIENGLFSGLAVNAEGLPEASMGMAVGDYDLDGDADIFFTHLMNESNTLYKNNGKGFFQDVTNRSNLSRDSFAYTGWATGFIQVNEDIYPDLVVFNGAVADDSNKNEGMKSLKQANQLFINTTSGRFNVVEDEKWLQHKAISRGAAFGDMDNDGDVDIIVNNNNDVPRILLNNLNPNQWLGLETSFCKSCQIQLQKGNKKYWLKSTVDGSYASVADDRITLNQTQIKEFDKIIFYQYGKKVSEQSLSATNKYDKPKLK